jgi:hypothetical protein
MISLRCVSAFAKISHTTDYTGDIVGNRSFFAVERTLAR